MKLMMIGAVVLSLVAASAAAGETKPAAEAAAKPPAKTAKAKAKAKSPAPSKSQMKLHPSKSTAPATTGPDSELVRAAKTQSSNRPKSRISISDEDVKKSSGKLILVSGTPEPTAPAAEAAPVDQKSEVQKAEELRKRRAEGEQQVEAARTEVKELENELARLEETYYTEDDPDFRDEVIQQRFDKTRQQLDKARERLSRARDELSKIQ